MIKWYVNQLSVRRVWNIEGYPNYFFGDDNQLYRVLAQGDIRRNQRCMKRYTWGYILKSKFFSLNQLRPMLRRNDAVSDQPMPF